MKTLCLYSIVGLLFARVSVQSVYAQDPVLQQEFSEESIDDRNYSAETLKEDIEELDYSDTQENLQQQYQQQSIEQHAFNDETWKKATEGLDYSDKRKKEPDEIKPKTPALNISEQTLRLIAFVVLFALLILILLRAFGVHISLGRKKPDSKKTFSVDEFDDHIPESELDRFLREAMERKDFRLAVRIYYLMAIRELSQRKLILWRKEKTNFDYLAELREGTPYQGFREVTLIFERVWYGELAINEQRFSELSSRFKHFLNSVKTIT